MKFSALEKTVGRLSSDVLELKNLIKKCLGQKPQRTEQRSRPEQLKSEEEVVDVPRANDVYAALLNECLAEDFDTMQLFKYVKDHPESATFHGYKLSTMQSDRKMKSSRKKLPVRKKQQKKRRKKGVSVGQKPKFDFSFLEDDCSKRKRKPRFGGVFSSGRAKKPKSERPPPQESISDFEDLEDIYAPRQKKREIPVLELSDSSDEEFNFQESDFATNAAMNKEAPLPFPFSD